MTIYSPTVNRKTLVELQLATSKQETSNSACALARQQIGLSSVRLLGVTVLFGIIHPELDLRG